MKKILLAIENEYTLDDADFVNAFINKYDGEVIEMTRFAHRSNQEVFVNVSKCTDIAVQTCFVNGSDNQLYGMVKLLAKMPHTINVYIMYLGSRYQNELREYLVDNLSPEDLLSIAHHNIYAMSRDRYESISNKEPHLLLDFTDITDKIRKERSKKMVHDLYIEHYKLTGRDRPTGRKVLVLMCTAHGKAFENLPIGEEVAELECADLLSKGSRPRGVWIWGNGEPVMLVNDHGFREYRITTKMDSESILREIGKVIATDKKLHKLKELKLRGLLHVIEDKEEANISKANIICEELKIPKRGNRQAIYLLLQENLVESE